MKISVIIPVYNGEKHIGKCIENIQQQSYENIEIIIINDGSKDNTKEIIEKYKRKDSRIVAVHKKNEGVSVARNTGIETATGDFIIFVDSDDFLEVGAIQCIVDSIKHADDIDMVFYGYQCIGKANDRETDIAVLKKLSDSKNLKSDIIRSIISTKNNIYGYIWRAAYKTDMLISKKIKFPRGIKISEDYMFLLNAVVCATNVTLIDKELYLYNLGEASMSNKYIPSLLKDMNYVNNWMYENIVKDRKELLTGYKCSIANTYLRYVQNSMRDPNLKLISKHKEIMKIKKKDGYDIIIKQIIKYRENFSRKSYISFIMFALNLEILYEVLFLAKENIKNRG